MLNLFAGFEQANKYKLTSLDGTPVGFLAEEDAGVLGTVSRQALRTRRPFRAVVLDLEGKPILWVSLQSELRSTGKAGGGRRESHKLRPCLVVSVPVKPKGR